MADIEYFDLQTRKQYDSIDALFPGWQGPKETVVFLAPHDDDAILGPGYLVHATHASSGRVGVIQFCSGDAGYSTMDLKERIVDIRAREMEAAMKVVGVTPEMLLRLDLPDLSLPNFEGRILPGGREGIFGRLVTTLRKWHATRLVFANGYLEHIDHSAVEREALYAGPHAGDDYAPDWAPASEPIRTYLTYNCWGEFSPMDAILAERDTGIRANWAIVASQAVEDRMQEAIRKFQSQGKIIESILLNRQHRRLAGEPAGYVELYLRVQARPQLEYAPYRTLVEKIRGRKSAPRKGPAKGRRRK